MPGPSYPMDDLLTLRSLGGDPGRRWLASLLTAEQCGSCLVMALEGSDNVARADSMLAALERLGWAERSVFAPSREQQFFGVGGSFKIDAPSVKAHHGQLWTWRATPHGRDAIAEFTADLPRPSALVVGDEVRYRPSFVAQIQGGAGMRRVRGVVVGYALGDHAVRVRWDDDPSEERARESPYWEGEGDPERRVPFVARAVARAAVQRVG